MKKIIFPLLVIATLVSCNKNEDKKNINDVSLETLIKNKDIEGLKAYKEKQKNLLDSLSANMAEVDEVLKELGISTLEEGFVKVEKLDQSSFIHSVELQGNVTTDQDVTITPEFSGLLTLFVKEGQRVSKGQVIGKINDGGLEDQYKQAQIQVSAAKAQLQQVMASANLSKITYEKQSKLWSQKIGSEFQYLQAKTAYEASQKQISAAQSQVQATQKAADFVKANLAKTSIKAPFSGVVDEIIIQNGQVVGPGAQILKLISLGMMRVEASVPEIYLANVNVGTPVKVTLPTINKTFNTSIRRVGNYIDPKNRTFTIQIPIPNEGGMVKPNLLAKLEIQDYVNPSAIQVPSQYVYQDSEKKDYVFIAENLKDGKAVAKKVYVGLGEKSANSIEITTGLESGVILITDGSKNLIDGQRVKVN